MRTRGLATDREIDVLLAYCKTGSVKEAAYYLGIAVQSARNALSELYGVLGVHSAIEAAAALGWLILPPQPARCGRVVHCKLPQDHHGAHGIAA